MYRPKNCTVALPSSSKLSAVEMGESTKMEGAIEGTILQQISFSNPYHVAILGIIPVTLIYFLYPKVGKKPNIYHVKTPFTEYIVRTCKKLHEPFYPTPFARNRHLQTLLGPIMKRPKIIFNREYVDLPDGGCCALDWIKPNDGRDERPINIPVFIILPGLTGEVHSMSKLGKLATDRGYRSVVFNKRGHGGSKLTTPMMQGFGDPKDFRQVILHIKSKYSDVPLTALGSSAGSGLLASYLGEYGTDCMMSYATMISPGYDAEFLFTHAIKHPYDYLLMIQLKKLLKNHKEMLSSAVDMDKVMNAKKLISIEENLYCKLYGYQSMMEYWSNNNPVRNPTNIAIPVLVISSLDDPVCTKECIQYKLFSDYMSQSMLVTTHHGGHCGFMEGWGMEHWADKVALDYLDACLKYDPKTE